MSNRSMLQIFGLLAVISASLGGCAAPSIQPRELVVSRSVIEFAGLSGEPVIDRLASDWLENFNSNQVDRKDRLDDYEIGHIELVSQDDYEIVALVSFSVQTTTRNSNWIAGNGVPESDNWIRDKTIYLSVSLIDEEYRMEIIGTSL